MIFFLFKKCRYASFNFFLKYRPLLFIPISSIALLGWPVSSILLVIFRINTSFSDTSTRSQARDPKAGRPANMGMTRSWGRMLWGGVNEFVGALCTYLRFFSLLPSIDFVIVFSIGRTCLLKNRGCLVFSVSYIVEATRLVGGFYSLLALW